MLKKKQTDRLSYTHSDWRTDRQTDRQGMAARQTSRQTRTDRETDRQLQTHRRNMMKLQSLGTAQCDELHAHGLTLTSVEMIDEDADR